jgi:hypothetical protein
LMSARRRDSSRCDSTPHPGITLLLWPASLRWTRRLVMEGPQVAGSSVRTAVLDNGWLISRRCRQPTRNALRADQGGFQCLLIQGRCPAEYLALLHRTRLRVLTSASSARWICNRIRKWLYQCAHAFVHALWSHKAIPWLPLCTGCCSVPPWRRTLPSSRIRFWSEYGLGCVPGCPGCPFCHRRGR